MKPEPLQRVPFVVVIVNCRSKLFWYSGLIGSCFAVLDGAKMGQRGRWIVLKRIQWRHGWVKAGHFIRKVDSRIVLKSHSRKKGEKRQ